MKNTKKVLLGGVAALALVGTSVFGTYMYLTSQDSVTNTFTVGNVKISMDEAEVDTDGKELSSGERTQENTYHIYPGMPYDKDPTVYVDTNSEDCYLFVKVVNGLSNVPTKKIDPESSEKVYLNIEAEQSDDYDTIATQMSKNGWVQLYDADNKAVTNVYYYAGHGNNVLTCSGGDKHVVFEKFKISSSISSEDYESIKTTLIDPDKENGGERVDALITVDAYAVQATGFKSPYAAWVAANF